MTDMNDKLTNEIIKEETINQPCKDPECWCNDQSFRVDAGRDPHTIRVPHLVCVR